MIINCQVILLRFSLCSFLFYSRYTNCIYFILFYIYYTNWHICTNIIICRAPRIAAFSWRGYPTQICVNYYYYCHLQATVRLAIISTFVYVWKLQVSLENVEYLKTNQSTCGVTSKKPVKMTPQVDWLVFKCSTFSGETCNFQA